MIEDIHGVWRARFRWPWGQSSLVAVCPEWRVCGSAMPAAQTGHAGTDPGPAGQLPACATVAERQEGSGLKTGSETWM